MYHFTSVEEYINILNVLVTAEYSLFMRFIYSNYPSLCVLCMYNVHYRTIYSFKCIYCVYVFK